ncbi:MAG: GtrA family protein [Clostridia bacterium]|nr:GtrA family protein [Clostridia bacterium]
MIEKLKAIYKAHKEGILYLIFGGLTTLISILSFWLFSLMLGEEKYLLSNFLSWVLAVIFAFVTNKTLVFGSKKTDKSTLLREGLEFLGARVFSLGLEEGGLWLLLDAFGMALLPSGDLIAKVIMSVIVILVNYFLSKFIIFKKK